MIEAVFIIVLLMVSLSMTLIVLCESPDTE